MCVYIYIYIYIHIYKKRERESEGGKRRARERYTPPLYTLRQPRHPKRVSEQVSKLLCVQCRVEYVQYRVQCVQHRLECVPGQCVFARMISG